MDFTPQFYIGRIADIASLMGARPVPNVMIHLDHDSLTHASRETLGLMPVPAVLAWRWLLRAAELTECFHRRRDCPDTFGSDA
jgi:hypothetical protein